MPHALKVVVIIALALAVAYLLLLVGVLIAGQFGEGEEHSLAALTNLIWRGEA
jgi:hypothetical protein